MGIILMALALCLGGGLPEPDLLLVDWNLENFFDYRAEANGSESLGGESRISTDSNINSSDYEFSAEGPRHWTKKRFYTKCSAVSKVLFLIADTHGRLPDIICMQEIENRFVLKQLLSSTSLRKLDYRIVHFESHDRRGIDCALLYRASRLKLVDSAPKHLYEVPAMNVDAKAAAEKVNAGAAAELAGSGNHGHVDEINFLSVGPAAAGPDSVRQSKFPTDSAPVILPTRDILLCCFELLPKAEDSTSDGKPIYDDVNHSRTDDRVKVDHAASNRRLAVLVNHHPSKVGGSSDHRRDIAMARMNQLCDSLQLAGWQAIVSVGDFNDNVWARGVDGSENNGRARGTIKYNGAWEKIDGHFARGQVAVEESIFDHPALSTADKAFGGTKPLRTYSGPRYLGGISDHYPIVLEIKLLNK